MSDAKFQPQFVPQRYSDRVQRAAVLYPMFGALNKPEEVIDSTIKLQRVWRKFLQIAQDYDWSPGGAGDAAAMQYARNCLPAFVRGKPVTKCCRLDYICPFCYARKVRDVWESLDMAFPNPRSLTPPTHQIRMNESDTRASRTLELESDLEEHRGQEFPYWLIERRNEVNLPFLPEKVYEDLLAMLPKKRTVAEVAQRVKLAPPDISKTEREERFAKAAEVRAVDWPRFYANLQSLLAGMVTGRQKLRVLKPLGMFVMTVIEPYDYGWHVEHRQLFMVEAGTNHDEYLAQTRGRLVTHTTPTRRTIYEAVIRTCAYPPKMLFRDPALLALLLRARKGFRLSATTGRFRNHADLKELRRRRRS